MSAGLPDLLIVLKTGFGCLLVAIIVTMAVIDCRQMILPNRLNFLLAATGIGQAILVGQPDPGDAALGALLGFVVLGGVAALFRQLRGIDGLGFGDQKFSAAAGLWIGWQGIAPMLLIASCSALIFVTIRSAKARKFDAAARLPFGPFLGLGTMACWLIAFAPGP
ncbi:MAG TPA: A24 family peptidase [Bradyrhizobium sp.]|nr:A24 family peptidase [Bradyrhizobium sp.]